MPSCGSRTWCLLICFWASSFKCTCLHTSSQQKSCTDSADAEARISIAHVSSKLLRGYMDCKPFNCICRYYSSELHSAAFVLPAFARRELGSSLTF